MTPPGGLHSRARVDPAPGACADGRGAVGREGAGAWVGGVWRPAGAARPERAAGGFGDLQIDYAQHRATVAGREIELTPGEYRLLERLALNAGRVVVQDELLRRVWGQGFEGETALLQTAIRRLRGKIEDDPAVPRHVLTKRGVGYWLPKS